MPLGWGDKIDTQRTMPFNREKLVATVRRKRGRLQPSSRAERDFSRRGAATRTVKPHFAQKNAANHKGSPRRGSGSLPLGWGDEIDTQRTMPFNREKLVATARRKRGRLQPSSRAERDFSRRGAATRTVKPHFAQKNATNHKGSPRRGAGEGNRTLVFSLGS